MRRFFLASAMLLAPLGGVAHDLEAQAFDPAAFEALTYRMVGPYRGGRSTAVTGFVDDPDRWLMGTTGGGIWESTDNGVTWSNISDDFFGGSIGAVRVADSDPNVKVYEAWCRYQIAGREEQAQQKALLVMQTIVEDAPGCATAHYYMGLLLVHGGNATKARVAFNNALTHNPRLTDAARQLRAIDMRKRSASAEAKKPESPSPRSKSKSEKSGGLRGLFGKK